MQLDHVIYHENNLERPYIPQEDFYAQKDNVFIVADGITHDLIKGLYPTPSDSAEVARIICGSVLSSLVDSQKEIEDIRRAFKVANDNVAKFNENRPLFLNREKNGYTIGAAVCAVVIIKDNRLLYGVLDDCYFSIFSEDFVDHPLLKSYVDKSAKHYDKYHDWELPEHRMVWRKDYRNNKLEIEGETYGYGALDGSEGYEQYIQFGEEELKPNDLICLYTDGFIKIMNDTNFVKKVKDSEFKMDLLEYISNYTKDEKIHKEKTCYFIRYSAK